MMPDPAKLSMPQINLRAPSIQRRFIASQTDDPNTTADVLAVLKNQPSLLLRRAVAAHPNAGAVTLATLCCDSERAIRATAVENPNCPQDVHSLLVAAGATLDLQGVGRQFDALDTDQLTFLAALGSWGRFLAARHPA